MTLVDWALLWSPVVPVETAHRAWRQLALPGEPETLHSEFLSAFHHATPLPAVPLVLHHTLNRPGDAVREEWMRVMAWLDLEFGETRLPPDHLAVACEVCAVAAAREERVIVRELVQRYLRPWCQVATERLDAAGSRLLPLPRRFECDLEAAA